MRTRVYRSKRIGKYRITTSMSPSEAIVVGLLDSASKIQLKGWLLTFAIFLKYTLIYVFFSTFIFIIPSVLIGEHFGNANLGGFIGSIIFIGIPIIWSLWKLWLYIEEKNKEREIEREVNKRNN